MTLRAIMGFDHIPTDVNHPSAYTGELMSFFQYSGTTKLWKQANGWMSANPTTAASIAYARFIPGTITDPSSNYSVFGMRWRFTGTATQANNTGVCWMAIATGTMANNYQAMFLMSDLIAAGFAVGPGSEHYLELRIDHAGKVVERWIDGTKLANLTMITAIGNLMAARSYAFFISGGEAVNIGVDFRDIYFLDEMPTGDNNARLGPQRVGKLNLVSADGTWAPSAGADEMAVLNTALSAANNTTPVIASPVDGSELKLKFTPPTGLSVAAKIAGVAIISSLGRNSVTGRMRTDFDAGAIEGQSQTFDLTTVITHGKQLVAERAPGDHAWTLSDINALDFKLMPVAG